MRKEKVKNQHYVTKGLLNHFSNSESSIDVFCRSKNSIYVKRSPKSYCVVKNDYFYDGLDAYIDINGDVKHVGSKQLLDETYARMEDEILKLIKKMSKDYTLFDIRENNNKLILFVHLLSERTKAVRDLYDRMQKDEDDLVKSFGLKNIPSVEARTRHNFEQLDMRKTYDDIKKILTIYDIYLAVNKTKEPFIISDDPAFYLRLWANDFCVPLMPHLGMIFRSKTGPYICEKLAIRESIVDLDVISVIKYNTLQFVTGDYVFGNENKLKYYKKLFDLNGGTCCE